MACSMPPSQEREKAVVAVFIRLALVCDWGFVYLYEFLFFYIRLFYGVSFLFLAAQRSYSTSKRNESYVLLSRLVGYFRGGEGIS